MVKLNTGLKQRKDLPRYYTNQQRERIIAEIQNANNSEEEKIFTKIRKLSHMNKHCLFCGKSKKQMVIKKQSKQPQSKKLMQPNPKRPKPQSSQKLAEAKAPEANPNAKQVNQEQTKSR